MSTTILSSPVGLDSLDGKLAQTPIGAVSWGAIFAGAAAAAALSLILLILGVGLGLSSISPWSTQGITAATLGMSTVLWLSFTQLAASGMGGYLAGRLRSRWLRTQADEVYFRDTAHGFLAWAVATLITAATLGSAIGSIVSVGSQMGGASAVAATASGAAATTRIAPSMESTNVEHAQDYYVDALFRRPPMAQEMATNTTDAATVASPSVPQTPMNPPAQAPAATGLADASASSSEAGRIFAHAIVGGSLTPDDSNYLGQMVSQRTGLSQGEAQKRVGDVFTRLQTQLNEAQTTARAAADDARKASSYAALWLFVSLLIGAFFASLMATFGGRQRDLN